MVSRVKTTARLNKEDGFAAVITIPNSSVLTLNTVGYVLINAPVNGNLVITLLELMAKIGPGTPYISVHNMIVAYGAPLSQGTTIMTIPGIGFLDQSVSTGVIGVLNGTSGGGLIFTKSSGQVSILMGTENPAQGTSPMTIGLKYRTHSLQ